MLPINFLERQKTKRQWAENGKTTSRYLGRITIGIQIFHPQICRLKLRIITKDEQLIHHPHPQTTDWRMVTSLPPWVTRVDPQVPILFCMVGIRKGLKFNRWRLDRWTDGAKAGKKFSPSLGWGWVSANELVALAFSHGEQLQLGGATRPFLSHIRNLKKPWSGGQWADCFRVKMFPTSCGSEIFEILKA